MNPDDRLQHNIRHSTARYALQQIHTLADAENADHVYKARALRGLLRDGWLVLLFAPILGVL